MALRFDAVPLGQIERTPTGGLRIPATLARTGIQVYTNPDGTQRREYRPPTEVFSEKSIASLRGAPVTYLHPGTGRVDAADWRRLAVGHVGEDVRQEGTHIAATVYVQDADVIAAIESGRLREISLGYDTLYLATPGRTPEGEEYDGIQTEILNNHAALVPRGRAGSTVGLRLDAEDNQIPEERQNVKKIKINGVEVEVSEEAAAQIAALQTRTDAAEAAAAVARVGRLRDRAALVGVEIRTDASEGEIMTEVLRKLVPGVKTEGASPDFLMGAFMVAVSLKLEADATGEESSEPEEPDPAAPAGPSAAAVRQDMLELRVSRAKPKAPELRTDEDAGGMSPAEAARAKMIEKGARLGRTA